MALRRNTSTWRSSRQRGGGILRGGLALSSVMWQSSRTSRPILGEYGIDDVEAMAKVKALVYRGLKPGGIRVINGDDPLLTGYMTTEPHETISFSLMRATRSWCRITQGSRADLRDRFTRPRRRG